ncbi:acyl-CoA dehydrogenase family protein [Streptomyces sp. NPDC091972]|uniref:acyl-CoA dehydrogenase family protein n=1 Tax=Streptomyces sp. NPDC091972 TaxID=3366007 RepID=UPI0038046902
MTERTGSADRPAADEHEGLRQDILARTAGLHPLVEKYAAQGEEMRRIPNEVVNALTEAGAFRLLQPRRFGGAEAGLTELVDMSSDLAHADGSTSWVTMIIAVTNWLACLFPDKAQAEVFGVDPDAKVAGAAAPTGTGRRTEGGWIVSGRWPYSSGSWHATWAVVGVLLLDDDQQVTDQTLALIPTDELIVEDTWFNSGMRATGSNTLSGQDIFVPAHRVLSVPRAAEGDRPATASRQGLYSAAFGPMLSVCLAAPVLGLGEAALQWTIQQAAVKPLSFTVHGRQADSVGVQNLIGRAALRLRSARLHLRDVAAEVDTAAEEGRSLTYGERGRIKAQTAHAVEESLAAIDTLLTVHGAGAFADASPLQRMWRDANAAARHAGLNPAVAQEVYGKHLLGVDETVSLMV